MASVVLTQQIPREAKPCKGEDVCVSRANKTNFAGGGFDTKAATNEFEFLTENYIQQNLPISLLT